MKITKQELSQIIKEEAQRFLAIKKLEAEKAKIEKMLNESYMEEEEFKEEENNVEEGVFGAIAGAAKKAKETAQTVLGQGDKVAANTTKEWISGNIKPEEMQMLRTDEAAFMKKYKEFSNYLTQKEQVGGSYLGLYLMPFFNTIGGPFAEKMAKQRNVAFKPQTAIDVQSGGLKEGDFNLQESVIRKMIKEEAEKMAKTKELKIRAKEIERKLNEL
jgi:hypothetical protein